MSWPVFRRKETSQLSTECLIVLDEEATIYQVSAYNFRDKKWEDSSRSIRKQWLHENYREETEEEWRERFIDKWGTD